MKHTRRGAVALLTAAIVLPACAALAVMGVFRSFLSEAAAEALIARSAARQELLAHELAEQLPGPAPAAAGPGHRVRLGELVKELDREVRSLSTLRRAAPDLPEARDVESLWRKARRPLLAVARGRVRKGELGSIYGRLQPLAGRLSRASSALATAAARKAAALRERMFLALVVVAALDAALVLLAAWVTRGYVLERKRAQTALEESAERNRRVIESALDGFVAMDAEGRITDWSGQAEETFGWRREEVLGRKVADVIIPPQHREAHERGLNRFLKTGKGTLLNKRIEITALYRDGHEFPVELTVTAFRSREGWAFTAFVRDITERRRAEAEARAHAALDAAYDAIVTMGPDGTIFDFNPAAEMIFGWSREEVIGKHLADVISPPRHRETHKKGLETYRKTGQSPLLGRRFEATAMRRSGEEFPVEVSLAPFKTAAGDGLTAFIRDISRHRQREAERRHAQKLQAVGQLAAGIAHEINTPIQFVGDNAHFLRDAFRSLQEVLQKYRTLREAAAAGAIDPRLLEELRETEDEADVDYLAEEIPKALDQTLEGVNRVATIVRAMKDFAHPDSGKQAAADLNQALLSTLTVARNEIKYVADVETELGDIPPVVCHVGDLNQVFLNLLVNAAHAIADKVKGTGEKGLIKVRTARKGDEVLITISDTGTGIPEEIRDRIFDPFFTTKEVGRGTGQGLAVARAIVVEKHRGSLTFESTPGKGTTFFIRLPIGGVPARAGEAAA